MAKATTPFSRVGTLIIAILRESGRHRPSAEKSAGAMLRQIGENSDPDESGRWVECVFGVGRRAPGLADKEIRCRHAGRKFLRLQDAASVLDHLVGADAARDQIDPSVKRLARKAAVQVTQPGLGRGALGVIPFWKQAQATSDDRGARQLPVNICKAR